MLYPENIEQKLGFDQIRELLRAECNGILGISFVNKMRFSSDYDLICKLQNQADEFKQILLSGREFPDQNFLDMDGAIKKIAILGNFLIEEDWAQLKLALKTLISCLHYLDHADSAPYFHLRDLSFEISIDKSLPRSIEAVIDDTGRVKDNASPTLLELRNTMIAEQGKLRKKLTQILQTAQKDGMADEELGITIRNGRLVIPLFAEYKRKFKGFVHDESATGQTVFIEPEEVLETNNYIKELEYAEKREVIKILSNLTDNFKKHIPELKKANTFLGLVDFIRAKARLGLQMQSINPLKSKKQVINWSNSKHPLLFLANKKSNRKTIPLKMQLTAKDHILVISGPNAGGKSVCLKTVGLLQYMYQCGMPVPTSPDSEFGLFNDIFVDIGDEQSIENDLSTYSSHLTNLQYFIEKGDNKTLVLIDEFGTGTDPQYGGAIAEAILEKLNQKSVFAVLNTHYSNLKAMAENSEGLVNGAMRFETDKMEPLYELEIGKPGSSFALEIATKIGLSADIIESAKQKLGVDKVKMDRLLVELEKEKNSLMVKTFEMQAKEKALKEAIDQYDSLKTYLETNKSKLMTEAKIEAKEIIREANQLIEKTIRDIKENKADKAVTQQIRKEVEKHVEKLVVDIPKKQQEVQPIKGAIEPGDYVRIIGQDTIGQVNSLKANDLEIMIGEMKLNVKPNKVEKISKKDAEKVLGKEDKTNIKTKGVDIAEKMINFRVEHDFRGMRAEDALNELTYIMDDAILLSVREFKIVHGKGDGILRTVIRTKLKNFKEVESVNDEHADRGGDGATIVKLK